MSSTKARHLNPKKLIRSKWTAASPRNKEKHFIVTKIIPPESQDLPFDLIELEAVYSGRSFVLPWRELTNTQDWLQGWR